MADEMQNTMADEMPEQPKTVQLPAADKSEVLLRELKVLMTSGFARIDQDFDLQKGQIGVMQQELALVFSWKSDVEGRLKNNSDRARTASQIDLEQASTLTKERAAREALAVKVDALVEKQDAQTALLMQIVKLSEKPIVKLIATAVGTAVLGYLSAKGLK